MTRLCLGKVASGISRSGLTQAAACGREAGGAPPIWEVRTPARWVSNLTPRRRETMVFSKEAVEQRKAYVAQAEAVARELGKLTSASVRMLGFLGDEGPDNRLLDAIQRNSNEILALQRQLRELWAPHLTKP